MKARLVIFRRATLVRSQRWGWRLIASNGRIVATSGEGYSDKAQARFRGLTVADGRYEHPAVVMPS